MASLDYYRNAGAQTETLQIPQRRGVLIVNAADSRASAQAPFQKWDFVGKGARLVFRRDYVAVRVKLGISQNRGNPILEALRDEVLQALGFVVDLVPGVLENVVQEELQQAMVPNQLPSPALSRRGQTCAVVLLVMD